MPALLTDSVSTARTSHQTRGVGNARSNLHVVVCRRRASICVLGDELRMIALAMITQTDQDGDAPKKGRFERD